MTAVGGSVPHAQRTTVGGPFFEDLERGYVERGAPALTITEGHAALHQAALGGRLRLCLDADLAGQVTGAERPLLHPGLVCDVAIGQSTLITQRVIANLFYRGLVLRRSPQVGDTLRTSTEVLALKQNRGRPGRPATGLALLRIVTVDQEDRAVLDFTRCAMLPLRDSSGQTGRADDLGEAPSEPSAAALSAPIDGWDLDAWRRNVPPDDTLGLVDGRTWEVAGGDVVTCAPELARLTLNIASAHHDSAAGQAGQRLVYGGHTIGIAASQLTRALPNLLTIVAWHSCDHLAPVFEGDTLSSTVELERSAPVPARDGRLLHLRSRVRARRTDGSVADVLDWRLVGVAA